MAAVCLIPPDGHEKVTINNKQHVEKQAKVRGKYFWQGCGSAFNFCGSRSGSSCFFNADPDPALKKKSFQKFKKQKKIAFKRKKKHGDDPNLLQKL